MDELIYSVKEVFSDFLRKELTGYTTSRNTKEDINGTKPI